MTSIQKKLFGCLCLCSTLLLNACGNKAFLRRMQDLEMGIKNPSTVEELQTAIKKYDDKINTILLAQQRIAIWYKMLGQRYMDRKMYKKALTAFQSALDYYPENQNIFYQIGVCAGILAKSSLDVPQEEVPEYNRQTYFELSVDAYKRALELDPSYTRAAYALSVLYVFELNKPLEAIALLEPIAAKEKKPFETLFVLARAYFMAGQNERAVAVYDRIIADTTNAQYRSDAERNRALVQSAR